MTFWQLTTILIHTIIAPLTVGHALLYKRDSRAALGWVSVCIFFPVVGPFLYFLFGINRIRSRAENLHDKDLTRVLFGFERGEGAKPISPSPNKGLFSPEIQSIVNLADSLVDFPLASDNHVILLKNGEETYPVMLQAINNARSSVYLMSYILETNRTGQLFIDALKRANKRGIDVRVIIDGLGDMYSLPRASRLLKKSGVKVARFLPLSLWPPSLHINLRNHRKLLIIDDEVAFSGGMNIGDRHLVDDTENTNRTQDIHFKFCGPILKQFHEVFSETWKFTTEENFAEFSGNLNSIGDTSCRVIIDGPDENLDKLELTMIGAISAAKHSVRIITPYFLPSREMISALRTSSMKGVDVHIILPAKSNLPYVQWATNNMLAELLIFSIRISKQPAPFSHAKLLTIDNSYAIVGSANIDPRSLRLNFEIGIEIYSEEKLDYLIDYFSDIEKKSEPYNQKELDQRPFIVRLRDAICWLFSPYL